MKDINFHLDLSDHDYEVKMRHAEEWMWKDVDVNLQLKFRGREMYYQEAGISLIRRMREDLSQVGEPKAEPRLVGKSINLTLSPLPLGKRMRKFSKDDKSELD
jgi:translation initiation factor IF-3